MSINEVTVPDLGDVESVEVIEINVQPGDTVEKEQTWAVVESDKATLEIPSPFDGKVDSVKVSVGDQIKQGDLLGTMEVADGAAESGAASDADKDADEKDTESTESDAAETSEKPAAKSSGGGQEQEITVPVPDIGGAEDVEVFEINVEEGSVLQAEDTMIVLESDKATMEVPCPQAGTVTHVLVKVGDKVSEGTDILKLKVQGGAAASQPEQSASASSKPESESKPESKPESSAEKSKPQPSAAASAPSGAAPSGKSGKPVHAGPAVRRLARELGVDLAEVSATGPKKRILKEDVHEYVKQRMTGQGQAVAGASGLPELPDVDFSKWGETESQALSKLRRVSAANLHRSWVHIPHVTQFDDADITELEAFRKAEGARLKESGVKLTFLPFLIQAVVKTLQAFPKFNSSLSKDGTELILKKYINIGIAVDTPEGLVVPVVKDADQKSLVELAQELVTLSGKARDRKLSPADMQGGTFTISSLGGIGGTAFTPIVNWPEVSILGVSRSSHKPVYQDGEFVPRLILPLSLSYDHRVIDGADAARFTRHLAGILEDIRRVLL